MRGTGGAAPGCPGPWSDASGQVRSWWPAGVLGTPLLRLRSPRGYVHPSGWQLVATIGFHYIAPSATLLGWLPIASITYTFIRGALVPWYPYPFLDVDQTGWGSDPWHGVGTRPGRGPDGAPVVADMPAMTHDHLIP